MPSSPTYTFLAILPSGQTLALVNNSGAFSYQIFPSISALAAAQAGI